jgi:hypothetical protein
MRWLEHVARRRPIRNAYTVLVVTMNRKRRFVDLGANGNLILRCILKK